MMVQFYADGFPTINVSCKFVDVVAVEVSNLVAVGIGKQLGMVSYQYYPLCMMQIIMLLYSTFFRFGGIKLMYSLAWYMYNCYLPSALFLTSALCTLLLICWVCQLRWVIEDHVYGLLQTNATCYTFVNVNDIDVASYLGWIVHCIPIAMVMVPHQEKSFLNDVLRQTS